MYVMGGAGSECSPFATVVHVWLERYREIISTGPGPQDGNCVMTRTIPGRYRAEKRNVTTAAETNNCEQVYEETLQLQAPEGTLLRVLFFGVRQHGDLEENIFIFFRDNIGCRLCLKVVNQHDQLAKRNLYITDYISLHTDPVHIY